MTETLEIISSLQKMLDAKSAEVQSWKEHLENAINELNDWTLKFQEACAGGKVPEGDVNEEVGERIGHILAYQSAFCASASHLIFAQKMDQYVQGMSQGTPRSAVLESILFALSKPITQEVGN